MKTAINWDRNGFAIINGAQWMRETCDAGLPWAAKRGRALDLIPAMAGMPGVELLPPLLNVRGRSGYTARFPLNPSDPSQMDSMTAEEASIAYESAGGSYWIQRDKPGTFLVLKTAACASSIVGTFAFRNDPSRALRLALDHLLRREAQDEFHAPRAQ